MRNFRMEKLAELKKVAADSGPLNQSEVSTIEEHINYKRKILGQEYVDSAVAELASQIYSGFVSENKLKLALNPLNQDAFKKYIISYIVYFLLSTVSAETFTIKMIRPGMGFSGTKEQLEELQLALANAIVEGRAALPDPKEWNKQNESEKKRGTGRASSSGPQATRSPTKLDAPPGTKLQELAGSVVYNYTIIGPLEFSYFTGKTPEDKANEGSPKKVTSAYSKWERAAKTLNTLWATSGKAAASPAQAPAATSAPAAGTGSATPAASAAKPPDAQETVVGQVLQAMYGTKMAETPGIDLTREKRVLKIVMDSLSGSVGTGQRYAFSVARVLLDTNGALKASVPATAYEAMKSKDFLTNLQVAINTLYKSAFEWSKAQARGGGHHAGLWERIKAKTFSQADAGKILKDYITSGLNMKLVTSKNHDSKFVKAATLRRLKIRSQMEAAIDSSAQMGRARVS